MGSVVIVLTLLPLVGAFGVWLPAAVYLLAVGRPVASTALAVYGLLVTSRIRTSGQR